MGCFLPFLGVGHREFRSGSNEGRQSTKEKKFNCFMPYTRLILCSPYLHQFLTTSSFPCAKLHLRTFTSFKTSVRTFFSHRLPSHQRSIMAEITHPTIKGKISRFASLFRSFLLTLIFPPETTQRGKHYLGVFLLQIKTWSGQELPPAWLCVSCFTFRDPVLKCPSLRICLHFIRD